MVQYNIILHTAQQHRRQNFDQTSHLRKTPISRHNGRALGVFVILLWGKGPRYIGSPLCLIHTSFFLTGRFPMRCALSMIRKKQIYFPYTKSACKGRPWIWVAKRIDYWSFAKHHTVLAENISLKTFILYIKLNVYTLRCYEIFFNFALYIKMQRTALCKICFGGKCVSWIIYIYIYRERERDARHLLLYSNSMQF